LEVPQAFAQRQVLAPICGVLQVGDAFSRSHFGDHIGTGTDHWLKRTLVKGFPFPGMFRKDGHHADDQWKLPVACFLMEDDRMVVRSFDLADLRIGVLEIRSALVAQGFHREHHVRRRHRLAIGKFGLRPDLERECLPVVADIYAFRQQPVEGKGFVPVPPHQAFEHIGANPHDRRALHDER